jgi:hypothetical protein
MSPQAILGPPPSISATLCMVARAKSATILDMSLAATVFREGGAGRTKLEPLKLSENVGAQRLGHGGTFSSRRKMSSDALREF